MAFRAQGRILVGALRLMVLAVVPILVMAVPVLLFMAQLSLWYQAQPLRVGEEAVVALKLRGDADASWPDVRLEPTAAVEATVGPVRVRSQRTMYWNVKAREAGCHHLVFHVDGQTADKQLAVGDSFMRVSTQRPEWDWWDALLHPLEPWFAVDSPVRSIEIDYPSRPSWTSGTNRWVYYWFAVSMAAALVFRRVFKVNV